MLSALGCLEKWESKQCVWTREIYFSQKWIWKSICSSWRLWFKLSLKRMEWAGEALTFWRIFSLQYHTKPSKCNKHTWSLTPENLCCRTETWRLKDYSCWEKNDRKNENPLLSWTSKFLHRKQLQNYHCINP